MTRVLLPYGVLVLRPFLAMFYMPSFQGKRRVVRVVFPFPLIKAERWEGYGK